MKQKIAEIINIIFGFRKFLIMLLVYALALIFRCKDLIDGHDFTTLIKDTTIGFLGANGIEHVTTAVSNYVGSKSQGDDPKTPYEDLVEPSQEAADLKAEEDQKNG